MAVGCAVAGVCQWLVLCSGWFSWLLYTVGFFWPKMSRQVKDMIWLGVVLFFPINHVAFPRIDFVVKTQVQFKTKTKQKLWLSLMVITDTVGGVATFTQTLSLTEASYISTGCDICLFICVNVISCSFISVSFIIICYSFYRVSVTMRIIRYKRVAFLP